MIDIRAQQIMDLYYADYRYFFSKPNVVGIGYGYKETNGITTCETCIQVFVEKKVATNCLPQDRMIPPLYKGVKTDVIESGNFISSGMPPSNCSNPSNASGPYTGRVRPIQPGWSMSTNFDKPPFSNMLTGTLGYIVTDNEQVSKTFCLLSVNKTFADLNRYPIGGEVLQPSYKFGGRAPQDVVGKLLKYAPIKIIGFDDPEPPLEEMNVIDASVASFVSTPPIELIDPFIPPNRVWLDGIIEPQLGMNVGWTSCDIGYTGNLPVTSLNAIVKTVIPVFSSAWFKNVTLTNSFSFEDSFGALVTTPHTAVPLVKALGLLFATDSLSKHSAFCSIRTIQEMLKVSLLISP